MTQVAFDSSSLGEVLPIYYNKFFPVKLMYDWLSYGNPEFFSHREFSFTLAGDVYIRYQSFKSAEDFLVELKKRLPEKIDIGAVYNQMPRCRDTLREFIPLKKEFVLDIDLTDYDDVRQCCQGAKVCPKCWKFIAVAVEILNRTLREDFGFQHLLWVFSGRRGVHCWVCDKTAIDMDSQARTAILEYLTVIRGGENQAKKVKLPERVDKVKSTDLHLHPFLARAIKVIDEVFEDICHEEQNMLQKGDKNFEMLPAEVKEATINATDRFQAVLEYLSNNKQKKSLRACEAELKLQLCFPRLDVNVSKDLNHLLKSPFCIHPKTGQVCVPFDPKKAFEFQPLEVPTISALLNEMDINKTESDEKEGFESNLLLPYLQVFKKFVEGLRKQNSIIKADSGKKSFLPNEI